MLATWEWAQIASETRFHLGRHGLGDFVLDGEDVGHLPLEPLRPKVVAVGNADELGGDPQLLPGLPDAPLQDILHVELFADLACIDILPLKRKGRRAGDHPEVSDLGQAVDEFLGEPFAKIVLLRVGAHVLEGKDGDGCFICGRLDCRHFRLFYSAERGEEFLSANPAFAPVFFEASEDDPAQALRNKAVEIPGVSRLFRLVFQEQVHGGFRFEGKPAGQHVVKDDPQGIEVRALVDVSRPRLLGRL